MGLIGSIDHRIRVSEPAERIDLTDRFAMKVDDIQFARDQEQPIVDAHLLIDRRWGETVPIRSNVNINWTDRSNKRVGAFRFDSSESIRLKCDQN